MPEFDASTAECLVFTYKEGLLSPVAHDLKIRVTKLSIDVDADARAIEATFDARSLRVVCAVEGEKDLRGRLSRENKKEIEENIARYVLDSKKHPEIRFVSSSVREKNDAFTVEGRLTIKEETRGISVGVRLDGDRYVAEARVHQPDFGIRPYSALLGTLKVKADVLVRVSVPA